MEWRKIGMLVVLGVQGYSAYVMMGEQWREEGHVYGFRNPDYIPKFIRGEDGEDEKKKGEKETPAKSK